MLDCVDTTTTSSHTLNKLDTKFTVGYQERSVRNVSRSAGGPDLDRPRIKISNHILTFHTGLVIRLFILGVMYFFFYFLPMYGLSQHRVCHNVTGMGCCAISR